MICQTYNSISDLQKKYGKYSLFATNRIGGFFMMELDIIGKVLGLKEQQWSDERDMSFLDKLIAFSKGLQKYNKKLNYSMIFKLKITI